MLNWKPLQEAGQLDELVAESFHQPVVIFKHSTRCSISTMAKARLEREKSLEHVRFYYLDLLNYRSLSHQIAERFQVHHESPQVLLIRAGECVYDESHQGIQMRELQEQLSC